MTAKSIAWIERLIWILIYGGLFALILGVVSGDVHVIAGWSLGVIGGIAVATGIVLIWVRSRLRETAPGAESKPARTQGTSK